MTYQKLYTQVLDALEQIAVFYGGDLGGLILTYTDLETIAERCRELLDTVKEQIDLIENPDDPREEALTPQERNSDFRSWK
jgi:hypothetical protein